MKKVTNKLMIAVRRD